MRLHVVLVAAVTLLGLPGVARAQGSDLSSFAVVGNTQVRIGKGVRVLNGNLGSNGSLSLGTNTIAVGGAAADKVRGARGVVVQGGVAFNDLSVNGGSFLGPQ